MEGALLYTSTLSNEKAYRFAEDNNLDIVTPMPDELQIDLDTEEDYQYYLKQLGILRRYLCLPSEPVVKPSRHGLPRRHVTVSLPSEISDKERLCLQACLGSDRVRELLCYLRVVICNEEKPIFFFEERVDG